jgi:hypothetical protein
MALQYAAQTTERVWCVFASFFYTILSAYIYIYESLQAIRANLVSSAAALPGVRQLQKLLLSPVQQGQVNGSAPPAPRVLAVVVAETPVDTPPDLSALSRLLRWCEGQATKGRGEMLDKKRGEGNA